MNESSFAHILFATGVSGLYVWGHKVLKPEELGYQALTYTAETAI